MTAVSDAQAKAAELQLAQAQAQAAVTAAQSQLQDAEAVTSTALATGDVERAQTAHAQTASAQDALDSAVAWLGRVTVASQAANLVLQQAQWNAQLQSAQQSLAADLANLQSAIAKAESDAAAMAAQVRALDALRSQVRQDQLAIANLNQALGQASALPSAPGQVESLLARVPWLHSAMAWTPSV